jgi:hypothetical protein
MPGVAQTKSIKAKVTRTVPEGAADDLSANGPITLNFIILNYLGTQWTGSPENPNHWGQAISKPDYTQRLGHGSGTNSTGFAGSFNAFSSAGGPTPTAPPMGRPATWCGNDNNGRGLLADGCFFSGNA